MLTLAVATATSSSLRAETHALALPLPARYCYRIIPACIPVQLLSPLKFVEYEKLKRVLPGQYCLLQYPSQVGTDALTRSKKHVATRTFE